jgi:hypothetical protein
MCGTVTPSSAECEIIILLAGNYEGGRTVTHVEERLLAPSMACCNIVGHMYGAKLVRVYCTDF